MEDKKMSKKVTVRALALAATGVLAMGAIPLTACKNSRDSIVIMAEEFSGLFNPFYATSGSDMDVVGLTQLSMLTTDSDGNLVAGDNEATVVKDYAITDDGQGNGVYTFVLKNGIKFSDGKPLTMNDVMFNIYEYLDPVYTGSSTMYSVKIQGLSKYRTQRNLSSAEEGNAQQDADSLEAYQNARARRAELVGVYEANGREGTGTSERYYLTPDDMKTAIAEWNVSETYQKIVPHPMNKENPEMKDYRDQLIEDYEFVLETFKKELNSDFSAARESFDLTTAPYAEWASKFNDEKTGDIFKFFLYEAGYITAEYEKVAGKDNRLKIVKFNGEDILESVKTQEEAVDRIYNDKVSQELQAVLTQWGTGGDVLTQFAAESRDVILNSRREEGQLLYPRVDGIVSLGHKVNGAYVLGDETAVKVNNKDYKIAKQHNADGTPVNSDEYDVLRITLDGKDPKAKYNFSFSVAPAHYYTADDAHPNGRTIDIEADNFGVEYADADFQGKTIQSQRNVELPLGAGPYKATNADNSDTPAGSEFWRNNYVYYKANHNFMFEVKTEKLQYQYVSSSNALDKLANREIDFVTPQFTKPNSDRLNTMEKDGFKKLYAWQLGYGYVGINAGKVTDINLRRAIMSAMEASLATGYYETNTCKVIDWPMSNQSWAYPTTNGQIGGPSKANGHNYTQWTGKEAAIEKINYYTGLANPSASKTYKFTIAGASISEHPTYEVFKQAADLLNECGWVVEVKADSQALTKLATGSLEVWAAAWGSTIDPDMYQVYHKNSTATSVYAWGYREILASPSTYSEENRIITQLSTIIDKARSMEEESERKPLYEQAMGLVLDLAVEMPIYQRQNLYAYDSNRISGINENVNPFTSPLEKIWNLEIIK